MPLNFKSDVVENNMCKTVNSWILEARCKSIITMLDEIRAMVMDMMTNMREFCNTGICDISPIEMAKLEENKLYLMNCHI